MKERLLQLFKRNEHNKPIREGTWHWLHSLIVNDDIDDIYTFKPKEIQLGVDDLLAQIYDIHHETTFTSVIQSVEMAGTKGLGHVFGLISRHGAGWCREEVFMLSTRATQIYHRLLAYSQTDAHVFLETIQTYHPTATVENNTVNMNIVKGEPEPVITYVFTEE